MVLALAALLAFSLMMDAVPAKRGQIRYTQPDGTTVTLFRHGDEFGHWTTDVHGNVVRRQADGFYREVTPAEGLAIRQRAVQKRAAANRQRAARAQARIAAGQKHFLVILVAFHDKAFTIEDPQAAFDRLLNEQGYSVNGGTGSARDFYYDNSHGCFEPIFDVYGPVTLDNKYAYYGGNDSSGYDKNPEQALIDGCNGLDDQIDFSRYDNDGDGKVDMVFMYYAGYGEADSDDEDSIWPHQWELSSAGKSLTLDGIQVDTYACTNELDSSGKMCGIGAACHEFGHAMGLPDMYDTDGDENGSAEGLYDFSTMCGGCYNNDSRTPPYFNIEERILLGWIDDSVFSEFPKTGTYTIAPVNGNAAYRTFTDQDGEYFVYENRAREGWDAHLPAFGMIAYHVDKSSRQVKTSSGTVTARDLWENWGLYNTLNANGSHPCFYVVPAKDPTNLGYGRKYYSGYGYYFDSSYYPDLPFPGGATSYTPESWNGEEGDISFEDISFRDNLVTLRAIVPSDELDFCVIADEGSYRAGDRFTFTLVEPAEVHPETVAWYFDDEPAGADSVTLTAGRHVVEARLTFAGGRTDRVTLEMEVL